VSTVSFLDKAPMPFFRQNVPAGLAAGAVRTVTINLAGYQNGRLRGNFHQDVAGTLVVEQGGSQTLMDLSWTVPRDLTQPEFQYPFDIIIIEPFVRITFTNGGAPSTFFRAFVVALPV